MGTRAEREHSQRSVSGAALHGTISAFGPNHTVAVTLARRLLNESFAVDFENAIGHFLAAQHRAIHQTPFLDTIRDHQKE